MTVSERANAVRRLVLKKHEKGITYDRIIKWLEGLKYEFDCEWNEFIDTTITQVKGGEYAS
jgi:aspartyl/asparaginyl-tRNA synthetase